MDQGIQITWYDLADDEQDDYLDWLHNNYLPEITARPGILWAAHFKIIKTDKTIQKLSKFVGRPDNIGDVPSGSEYALLVGAGSPHIFFASEFSNVDNKNLSTQQMFAKRVDARTVVTTEQARVNGPEINQRAPGATPGPFIQLGHFRVRSIEEEFDLNAWYAEYRLPAIAAMPGAIAARKLVTIAGWAKHVILYEFISAEAHHTNFMNHEVLAFEDGEWTNRVVKYTEHAPGSPSIGERLWPET